MLEAMNGLDQKCGQGASDSVPLSLLNRWISRCLVSSKKALFLAVCLLAATEARCEVDITEPLLTLPSVREAIAGICEDACAGNERKSWLHRATISNAGRMRLELRLRSKHKPFSNVVLYDDTAHVTAEATVLLLSCKIGDWTVKSNNDIYALVLPILKDTIDREIEALQGRCKEVFQP